VRTRTKLIVLFSATAALFLIALVLAYFLFFHNSAPVAEPAFVHLNQGEAYLLEENFEQAIREFRRAIELNPYDMHGYIGAANAYTSLGMYEEAFAILEQGFAILPDSLSIHQNIQELRLLLLSMDDEGVFEEYP